MYEQLKSMLCNFGTDVQVTAKKFYIAFKKHGNFASVQVQADGLVVFVRVDPDTINPEEKAFTKDMRNIGHQGTGDLKITLQSKDDLAKAARLLKKSYEDS